MGILSDIFVATAEDAASYESIMVAEEEHPSDKYEVVHLKGLTTLEFGTLWAILLEQEWDAERHMLANLTHGDEGESWLDQFPSDFVGLLASLDDQRSRSAAAAWAETEEMGCEASDVAPILTDLKRLAKRAQSTGRGLYLWGSL